MKADIITIGDEILIGQITDTNSQWIAEQLNLIGFTIRQMTSVADEKRHIIHALESVLNETDLVIITGGLGPTEDDITKQTLAEYFGSKLVINSDVLKHIEAFVKARGVFTLNERNRKQAEVPENCTVIHNPYGTAPGMLFKTNNKMVISLPAVPFEMKEIMLRSVIPLLQNEFKLPTVIHKNILTIGIPESTLAEKINDWESQLPPSVKLAYLPSPERIRLRLSMIVENKMEGETILDEEIKKLEKIIGPSIYGYGDLFLEEVIGILLSERHATLSTAESCTGGNIGQLITSIPGSSAYYKGGIIAYSNEIKERFLKVPRETIEKYGAVSRETVLCMAQNLKVLYDTDFAVAISGIAGPDGGTVEKPVGTVWVAIAGKENAIVVKYNFGSKRDINIRLASSRALDLLRKFILNIDISTK